MISILAVALVPVFLGLLAGYFAGIRKVVDNQNLKSLVSLVMTFALPCSLFLAVVKTPHRLLAGQGAFASCVVIAYAIVYALTYWFERRAGASPPESAVQSLTLAFPNATAVGLPLFEAIYGPQAVVAAALGITIGAVTITPVTLAILESATPAGRSQSTSARMAKSIWRALKRPVFWSSALGIVAAAFDLRLPPFLDRSLTIGGNVTAGGALFLTGLIVSAQRFDINGRVIMATVAKNLIQPALCLAVARLIGLSIEQTRNAVLLTAIPCGFFGLVFGKGFNTSPPVASSTLLLSYITGIVTLAGWIVWLGHLA